MNWLKFNRPLIYVSVGKLALLGVVMICAF